MVVAARDFTIQDNDGRLKLDDVSVALFGKDPGDGKPVEINTIRAKQAYLTFDKKLGQNETRNSAAGASSPPNCWVTKRTTSKSSTTIARRGATTICTSTSSKALSIMTRPKV